MLNNRPKDKQILKSFLTKLTGVIKNNYVVILSFIIPVIVTEAAYIYIGVYPFGGHDVLIIDLYHQYAPFLSELKEKLSSFSGLHYSFAGGLGANFLPLFAYYLASPLNFILVLFPKDFLTEAVLALILIKTGLAGASFSVYLKSLSVNSRNKEISIIAFSLLYALSGYMLAYSWNIMWTDALYLLPFVIIGINRLVRDGRGLFYTVILAVTLFSNFYIAIFVCIFSALYFPVSLFQNNNLKKPGFFIKISLKFTGYSLLSAGLASIILLPTYFFLKLTSIAGEVMPKTFRQYFDMFDYIGRNFLLASPSIREGMPNIYCGIIVLVLVPLYFFSRSISLKEKLLNLVLIIILFFSYNTDTLNFIWHGLHFPNQLPYRNSFIMIFLILTLAYRGYERINEFSGRQLGGFFAVLALMILLYQKLADSPSYYMLYITLAFVIVYAAVLTVHKQIALKPQVVALVFLLAVIAEVTVNTMVTMDTIDRTEYYSTREGYLAGREADDIRQQIDKIASEDKSFYRMEILPPKTTNDPYLYNYRGLSIFSSAVVENTVKMMQNLGYHSNGINSYKYEDSTILLDSFFGIKYLIRRTDTIDDSMFTQIAETDEIKVYENSYALPLGFLADIDAKNLNSWKGNPFTTQNKLFKEICGTEDLLLPVEQLQGNNSNLTYSVSMTTNYSYKRTNKSIESTARVRINAEKDQQIYLYYDISGKNVSKGIVKIEDKEISFNAVRSTLVNLGYCKAGSFIEVQLTMGKDSAESGSFKLYSYAIDRVAFESAISSIKEQAFAIEDYGSNYIKGSMEAKKDGLMVFTIPFDPGWKVKIDGEPVSAIAFDKGLLSFELKQGIHRIELSFIPDKYIEGSLITLVSLLILILIYILRDGKPSIVWKASTEPGR